MLLERLATALAAGRLVKTLLFGLSPADASTIVLSVVVMIGVSAVAGYVPARRASRMIQWSRYIKVRPSSLAAEDLKRSFSAAQDLSRMNLGTSTKTYVAQTESGFYLGEIIGQTGLLDPQKGVYVGGWVNPRDGWLHYLRHDGPEHVLGFAPTRSGKGVGLVIPPLLAWAESTVVYDMKGENWAKTAGFRAGQGHLCFKFSPVEESGTSGAGSACLPPCRILH